MKAKWWQKLKPRKGPKRRTAGDRPSARKTRKSFPSKIMGVLFGGVARVIGVILIVGGIVYGMVPTIRNNVNDEVSTVKNKVNSWMHPKRPQVRPSTTFSTTALKGHPASLATDPYSNTYWSAPVKVGGNQVELTVNFGKKVNLKNIVVYNGTGTSPDNYDSFARPAEIHLQYDNGSTGNDITLQDIPDKATYATHNSSGVTEIHIFVVNYSQKKGDTRMALARIDFFTS